MLRCALGIIVNISYSNQYSIFWNIRVKFVRQYPVECIDISKHFYTFVVFLRGQTYY